VQLFPSKAVGHGSVVDKVFRSSKIALSGLDNLPRCDHAEVGDEVGLDSLRILTGR